VNRQKIATYIQAVGPWSAKAFLLAAMALAVAAGVRSVFAYLGATLFFATYFPVVLIVSVVAGVPAGTATAVLALIIVWWAYIPPYYSFNSLSAS
jgi:K+-sensing histidine kinase KdpD